MLIFVRCASVLLIVQPFVRDFHITEEIVIYPYVLDPVTGMNCLAVISILLSDSLQAAKEIIPETLAEV